MRIAVRAVVLATALMGLASGIAWGAGQPPEEPPPAQDEERSVTQLDEIEVTGVRLRETVRRFVDDVSLTDSRRDQLGRFERYVCPGVVNLRPDFAEVMNDRIARMAHAVDLRVGEPGCRPNILIIFTPDSSDLVPVLIEDHPNGFARYVEGNGERKRALAKFLEPRPVRWWHAVEEMVTERSGSRLRAAHQTQFRRALLVVDTRLVGQVNFGALSDYVGMAALARLDPDAELEGMPTILNLFADGERSRREMTGLTTWDSDYLYGLYDSPRLAINRRFQAGDITWNMMRREAVRRADDTAETADD